MTALLLSRWQHATTEVPLFPQPAEHVAHHHRCHQPQRPQSGNSRYSLPSQHKADCCVERGQIVGDLLIGSSSLSLRHSRPAAASCLPPSLLRRLPQPAPPHLLLRYCAPLVQLIVVLPGGLPPPLNRCLCLSSRLPIHWLSHGVASRCLVPWPPPPFHHTSASCCTPLIWLVVASCCLAPWPLSPPGALASHHAATSCRAVLPPC